MTPQPKTNLPGPPQAQPEADQSTPQQTVVDLGRMIKQQYPEYRKLDDAVLGKMVRDKYPEQYKQYVDAPTAKPSVVPPSYPGWKPQELTRKDVNAIGADALPMVGGGLGAMIGGIPGAAMGGMLAETARQAVVSHSPESFQGQIFSSKPPGSAAQSRQGIIGAGFEQGAYEAGGTVASKILRGVIGGPLHAGTRELDNALVRQASEQYGLKLTAPEISGQGKMLQRLGEYSIFSQGYIRKKWGEAAQRGVAAIDGILAKLYPPSSPTEAGEDLQKMFKMSHDLFKEASNDIFENQLKAPAAAANLTINLKGFKAAAKARLGAAAPVSKAFGAVGDLTPKERSILEGIVNAPDEVPFAVAHEYRSKLMDVTPDPNEIMATRAQGTAKSMVKELTEAMDNSFNACSPQLQSVWHHAREFYKEGAELFDNAVIQGMMEKEPEALVNVIQPHAERTAQRIREAILNYPQRFGDPTQKRDAQFAWRRFQEQFIRSRILADPERASAATAPENLAEISGRIDALGPGVVGQVFNDADSAHVVRQLRYISDAFARVQKLPAEGRKYVYDIVNLAIAGAAAGFGVGAHASTGAFWTGASMAAGFETLPAMISVGIRSERFTQYLLDGIGGLIKASEHRPVQAVGRGLIKLQEKTITSDPSYRYLGKAVADLARSYTIYKGYRAKMDQWRKDHPDAPKPPQQGHQEAIRLMLDEWGK